MRIFLKLLLNTLNLGWKAALKKYQEITTVSLDEMVFENREKEYGAFPLRKNYPWHLITSLAVVLLVFLYLCFLPVFMGWLSGFDKKKGKTSYYQIQPIPSPPKVEKIGYITPKAARVLSTADLEEIKNQIAFRMPEPFPAIIEDKSDYSWHYPRKMAKQKGFGNDHQNRTIPSKLSHFNTPEIEPDTTILPGNQYPRIEKIEPPEDIEYFCGLTVSVKEEPPIGCSLGDIDPWIDPKAFVLVEEEPVPMNMEEVKSCIGFPTIYSSPTPFHVFRVLVDKKGNYRKHLVLQGEDSYLLKDIEACLPKLKFTPAIQADRPIPFWVNIPFRVELTN